jgi:hypothetical protein
MRLDITAQRWRRSSTRAATPARLMASRSLGGLDRVAGLSSVEAMGIDALRLPRYLVEW